MVFAWQHDKTENAGFIAQNGPDEPSCTLSDQPLVKPIKQDAGDGR